MQQSQVDYAALRYKSAKDLSSVANSVKSGNVAVEAVYVESLGKRVTKFRCPPGTRRGGKWTDRLGTDCELGPARAGLMKITRSVQKLDNAIGEAETRKLTGGPGLLRYQAGRAVERAGDIVDYAAQQTRKRGQAARVRLGQAVENAGDRVDAGVEKMRAGAARVGEKLEKLGDKFDAHAEAKRISQQAKRDLEDAMKAGEQISDTLPNDAADLSKIPADLGQLTEEDFKIIDAYRDKRYAEYLAWVKKNQPWNVPEKDSKKPKKDLVLPGEDKIIELKPAKDAIPMTADQKAAAIDLAAERIHEAWRDRQKNPDGSFPEFMVPDGKGGQLNLAETPFADLPKSYKDEYVATATHAVNELADRPSQLDKHAAAKIHGDWVKRNGINVPEELNQPFTDLPPELQAENLAIVKTTRESIQDALSGATAKANNENAPDLNVPEANTSEVPNAPEPKKPSAELPPPKPGDAQTDLAPPSGFESHIVEPDQPNAPSVDKQPLPPPNFDDQGKLPEPNRTIINKPEGGKKPTGPAKAAEASLDDAKAKNAKKTGKQLPGKNYGTQFKVLDNAKKWANEAAVTYEADMYVAEFPNGKYQIVDEERFKALGHKAVYAINKDGGLIQLEDPANSTPEQIVDEVAHEEVLAKDAAEAEQVALNVPKGSLNLTKSKTGAFLPDDFNESMLQPDVNDKFVTAFATQGMAVDEFWQNRLGGTPLSHDPNKALDQIDKLIADEKSKPHPNAAMLGVMNAERNNYLAMRMPDPGEKAIDPYQRVNFVGPKRRSMIIADAGLQDHIVPNSEVSKSGKDLAKKTDEAAADATASAEQLVVDKSKSAEGQIQKHLDYALNTPESKKTIQDKIAQFSTQDANEFTMQALNDAIDSSESFAAARRQDAINEIATKDHLSPELEKALMDAELHAESLRQYKPLLAEAIQKKNNAQINDAPDMPQIDTSPTLQQDLVKNATDVIENFKNDKETRAALIDAARAELDSNPPPVPDFTDKKSIDNWIDSQIMLAESKQSTAETLVENYKNAGEIPNQNLLHKSMDYAKVHADYWEARRAELHKDLAAKEAEASKPDAATIDLAKSMSAGDKNHFFIVHKDGSIETVQPDAPDLHHALDQSADGLGYHDGVAYPIDDLKMGKFNAPVEPTPTELKITADTVDKVGHAATLNSLFDSTQGFNYTMITSAEGQKMGDSLDSIISRVTSKSHYSQKIDDVLSKLPDDIASMSKEDQVKAILNAAGTGNDLEAAKVIARSIFTNQYGRADTLTKMRDAITNLSGNSAPNASADLEKAVEEARTVLTTAQNNLKNLPTDVAEPVRLHYVGALNDAKAKLVGSLAERHQQLKMNGGSGDELSKSFKDLNTAVQSLDGKIRVGIEKKINNGFSIEAGTPDNLVPKGMVKTGSEFDSTLLGSVQPDGKAIAYAVPLGNKGMFNSQDAAEHLATGGKLSDVPDDLLNDAIRQNLGANKRFMPVAGATQGYNETVQFIDSTNGNRYVIKAAHRNHMEHIQEVAGARLGQILGEPSVGIRFGSLPYEDSSLPGPQKTAEKVKAGLQRAIILDAVHNMFKGKGVNGKDLTVYNSLHDVPAGEQFSGDSLARMMVLDRTMNYFDRTAANMVPVKGPDGLIHLQPIDHGNGFRAFEGGSEQAAGFLKKTKGDNVDLAALVKKLSPEEKQKFAEALWDGVRRFQKADFQSEFANVADTMKVTNAERERLAKHAQFLEDKKKALDWEQMSRNAMVHAGLDNQAIEDIIHPPLPSAAYKTFDGLVVPQETMTVGNAKLGKAIDDMHVGAIARRFTYDGGDIRNFQVSASRVKFESTAFGISGQESTMLEFKRTGKAAAHVPSVSEGWQVLGHGHIVPSAQNGKEHPTFNSATTTSLPGSGGSTTWAKRLDDGSVVMVTLATNSKNSSDQLVRIVMPGDAQTALSDTQRVETAMTEVGVKSHGLPKPAELEKYALSSASSMLLGKKTGSVATLEANLQTMGLSKKNLLTYLDNEGVLRVKFDDEGVKKILDAAGNPVFNTHSFSYGGNSQLGVFNTFVDGSISSTTRRYQHGMPISGASSAADVQKGSGDFVFMFRQWNDNSPGSWSFAAPAEDLYSRTDWYSVSGDSYGNPSSNHGVSHGHAYKNSMENCFNQTIDLTRGITTVPTTAEYDSLIAKLHAAGVDDIKGVPIEDLIATVSTFKEKMKALRDRLAAEKA